MCSLPRGFSMGNQLSDGEKVVVTVFVTLLAGGVGGLFFFGGAILDMKDALTEVKVSVAGLDERMSGMQEDVTGMQEDITGMQEDVTGMREDITNLQEEVATFRAEVSDRFDALEGWLSVIETVMETHHGPLPRPAN